MCELFLTHQIISRKNLDDASEEKNEDAPEEKNEETIITESDYFEVDDDEDASEEHASEEHLVNELIFENNTNDFELENLTAAISILDESKNIKINETAMEMNNFVDSETQNFEPRMDNSTDAYSTETYIDEDTNVTDESLQDQITRSNLTAEDIETFIKIIVR